MRVVRAYRQEAAELERFAAANTEYVRRNLVLIRLQGAVLPEPGPVPRPRRLLVLWLGSRDVMQHRLTVGEFVAFNAYLGDADVADDRLRLGDQHAAARRGVVEADAGGDGHRAARGGRPGPAARCRRRAHPRAPSRFAASRFAYDGAPVLRDVSLSVDAGRDAGHCRADRLGQVHAHQPAAAPVRAAPRHGVHRRHRRARHPAAGAARRHRLRVAGAVPLLRDASATTSRSASDGPAPRPSGVGTGRRRRRRRPASRPPRPSRASTRTCRASRRATTRWSASAASRSPAGRSSAPPSRAAIATDPRILILDDALSAVDTYTEEEILSRLRGVMRQRTSVIVSHRDLDRPRRRPDRRPRRRAHRRARPPRRPHRARRARTRSCTGSSCWRRSWQGK